MMDWEGTSDIYCRAYINDSSKDKMTDTHWRCQNGTGSFNYRLILPIKSQEESYVLTVEAWDKDIIDGDDYIGGAQIDISALISDVVLTNKRWQLHKKYFDSYFREELAKT